MAEYRVSSWEEFVNAYIATAAAGETERTIEIMADIDCNDMPFSNYIKSPTGVEMTINGNQHNIWNISTESVVNGAIIRGSAKVNWNKVNFGNINRIENSPIFSGASTSNSMEFYDCTFVGKGFSIANNSKFYRSAITWTGCRGNGVISPYVSYYNCWLHVEITRTANNSVVEFNFFESCYVEGKIEGANDTITSAGAIASNINNSVINIESDLTRTQITQSTSFISVFNTTKMPNSTSNSANLIGVTDDQMKDAKYLSSVGFNIVAGD